MTYCEDYPCCGHTPSDPCERQPYDEPGYFDTSVNPHALCDHSEGFCDVWDEDEEEFDDDFPVSWEYPMEDQWLDGSYEE